MKDIDFDELDKAVNSLMADVPKTPVPNGPTEKTVEIPTTDNTIPVASSMPAPSSPASLSTKAPEEPKTAQAPQAAPASRRGGRFMDVVHPSSDMKKPEVTRSVSRQGVTVAPRPVATGPESPSDADTPTPVSSFGASSSEPAVSSEPASQKTDWPDPLDMAGFGDKNTPEPSADISKPAPEPKEEPEEEPDVPLEPVSEPPLTSPFLPDTKVEKRPLGGVASEEPIKEVETDLPKLVDEDDQLPATADDVKPLLPAELHSDLVAIESDTTGPKEDEALKSESDTPPKTEESPTWVEPKEEKAKETVTPAGPASIPQQYREEPSTGDQKNGAIYDTASYHQPLAHPAKQKSGWMWIVWILLILIIGAGGGAALYFLHII